MYKLLETHLQPLMFLRSRWAFFLWIWILCQCQNLSPPLQSGPGNVLPWAVLQIHAAGIRSIPRPYIRYKNRLCRWTNVETMYGQDPSEKTPCNVLSMSISLKVLSLPMDCDSSQVFTYSLTTVKDSMLQASTNTILLHFLAILFSNWVLRILNQKTGAAAA